MSPLPKNHCTSCGPHCHPTRRYSQCPHFTGAETEGQRVSVRGQAYEGWDPNSDGIDSVRNVYHIGDLLFGLPVSSVCFHLSVLVSGFL